MIKRAILATDLTVYMEYVEPENVKVLVVKAMRLSRLTPYTLVFFFLPVFLGEEKSSFLSRRKAE